MASTDSATEPVVNEGKVAGAVTAAATLLLGLGVVLGVITQDQVSTGVAVAVGIASAVVAGINYVVPILRARRARAKVVPLSKVVAYTSTPTSSTVLTGERATAPLTATRAVGGGTAVPSSTTVGELVGVRDVGP